MRLLVCLLLSIVLHAAGLLWVDSQTGDSGASGARPQIVLNFIHAELVDKTAPESEGTGEGPAQARATQEQPVHPESPRARKNPLPVIGPAEGIYYSRKALTEPPRLIEDVDLSVLSQLEGGAPGRVVLELFINEHGRVDRIEVESPGGADKVLGALRGVLSELRFSGGEINGSPVKTRLMIEVLFIAP